VFNGVYTPGVNPVDQLCTYARLPADLAGKRVLDVGAWNGCFSFECERRGAAEVVACSLENPDQSGFNRLKALLGSRVSYVQGSVYDLAPERMGVFDVVLFFGVLYHLRYPLLAVDRLRTVCGGSVYVETHVVSNRLMLRPPLALLGRLANIALLFRSTPIWRQYREYELHRGDRSNWFGPNAQAVMESFQSAGFDIVQVASWSDRAAFRADAVPVPERLLAGSYEGRNAANARLAGIPVHRAQLYSDGGPKRRGRG
jgi:tRNA (mo5U34)-methyltransferase